MTPDWQGESYIDHRSFRMVDLASDYDLIEDKIFEDCTIYGPALIVPVNNMVFESNTFEGTPDALFWVIPDEQDRVIGAIGLNNCTFRRCIFRRIGIAGKRDVIERFKQGGLK